jgi:adenylate cyclase class 2
MRAASKTGLRKSPGGAGGKAKREAKMEIEVKLRVADRRQLLRQLARLRAQLMGARVHEMNTLYDTAEGDLARHGRMLRVRVERPASRSKSSGKMQGKTRRGQPREASGFSALLTFKGPVRAPLRGAKRAAEKIGKKHRGPAYKIREEHEIRVSDHEGVSRIIERLGFRPCFRYEKFRTTYRLPGIRNLKVEVDETPIGLFLELEGPGREIDRAAARMGFGRAE